MWHKLYQVKEIAPVLMTLPYTHERDLVPPVQLIKNSVVSQSYQPRVEETKKVDPRNSPFSKPRTFRKLRMSQEIQKNK